MLALASRGGRLGMRIGPRIPMTFGPLVIAVSVLLMLRIGADVSYVLDVLPGVLVFGLGLSLMIAPLTATVLAAAPDEHAGIASGVNNAVARAGPLLAVAALPVAVGLHGDEYADPAAFDDAFRMAMVICAVLLAVGGVLSWLTIRNQRARAVRTRPRRLSTGRQRPTRLRHVGAHHETGCTMRNKGKAAAAATMVRLLENARYEVLPTASIEDTVLEHVGTSTRPSPSPPRPSKGLEATLDLAERLDRARLHRRPAPRGPDGPRPRRARRRSATG